MNDEGWRNVTDQRFRDDAIRRYLDSFPLPRMPVADGEWLVYFAEHFGNWYVVVAPETLAGNWTATASFGSKDVITSTCPSELYEEMREHLATHLQPNGQS